MMKQNHIKILQQKISENFLQTESLIKDLYYNSLIKYQKDRPSKDFRYFMNNNKAKKKLGWNNKISFSEGLDRTIKWHYKNLKNFKNIKYGYIHRK